MNLERLVMLEKQAKEAYKIAKNARYDFIKQCKHNIKHVVEAPYKEGDYLFRSEPDFRVCKRCGYAEEGWKRYYKLYAYKNVPIVTRSEGWKYVKLFLDNEKAYDYESGKIKLTDVSLRHI